MGGSETVFMSCYQVSDYHTGFHCVQLPSYPFCLHCPADSGKETKESCRQGFCIVLGHVIFRSTNNYFGETI